jgi:hypothetical protein
LWLIKRKYKQNDEIYKQKIESPYWQKNEKRKAYSNVIAQKEIIIKG